MGSAKGLLLLPDGRRWLERQCEALAAARLARATIVLGDDFQQYDTTLALRAGQTVRLSGIELSVVRNLQPELGPFSSLRCALSSESCFVLPIDTPAASPDVWFALRAHLTGGVLAAVACYRERGGHPVLLARELVEKLQRVPLASPQARLDQQLHALPEAAVARVEVESPAVIENLNTPEAFNAWVSPPTLR